MTNEEIRDTFTYHPPTPAGVHRHSKLSQGFIDLMTLIDDVCPDGRSKALARTKLEEAKFHASAAVAQDPSTR